MYVISQRFCCISINMNIIIQYRNFFSLPFLRCVAWWNNVCTFVRSMRLHRTKIRAERSGIDLISPTFNMASYVFRHHAGRQSSVGHWTNRFIILRFVLKHLKSYGCMWQCPYKMLKPHPWSGCLSSEVHSPCDSIIQVPGIELPASCAMWSATVMRIFSSLHWQCLEQDNVVIFNWSCERGN